MSRPGELGAVCYEAETNFGEAVTTYGTRLNYLGQLDLGAIMREKLAPERAVQFRQEITPGINGIMGVEFSLRFWLHGHGSTANTTITLNDLETLLGKVFGNVGAAFSAANTTLSGTGTKAAPGTTAANGAVAGSLLPIGALNDGRGGHQFYGVVSHSSSVLTLMNELIGNPSNGDVVFNAANWWPSESPTSNDITSLRFRFQTANLEIEAHGVYPKAVTFAGLGTGETPSITITFGGAWWDYSIATFPTALSVQTFSPAPVGAGSLFMNTQGVATRVVRSIRSFQLTYQLGVVELRGPGGVNAAQAIVGCKRVPDMITVEWIEDADAQTLTPDLPGKWDANTVFSVVYSCSTADGSSIAFKFPYAVADGPKPAQVVVDRLNRIRWRLRCGADVSKTTDRERAAMVGAFA